MVEDARGNVLMRGRDGLRDAYGPFFSDHPGLHDAINHRTAIGEYIIDEEEITGWRPEPVRAIAIYHVSGEVIDHVRLID